MIAGDSTRTELCSVHSQRINIKPFLSTATATTMLRVCPVDCGGGGSGGHDSAGCCTMAAVPGRVMILLRKVIQLGIISSGNYRLSRVFVQSLGEATTTTKRRDVVVELESGSSGRVGQNRKRQRLCIVSQLNPIYIYRLCDKIY